MDIGSTIRAIRKRKKITIAQICEETGLSQGFMSQVETNKTSPSIATLDNIAKALNVPLPYLLMKKERSNERCSEGGTKDHDERNRKFKGSTFELHEEFN